MTPSAGTPLAAPMRKESAQVRLWERVALAMPPARRGASHLHLPRLNPVPCAATLLQRPVSRAQRLDAAADPGGESEGEEDTDDVGCVRDGRPSKRAKISAASKSSGRVGARMSPCPPSPSAPGAQPSFATARASCKIPPLPSCRTRRSR